MVRALASHQCGPGSIPRLNVTCGLSLLVLYSAPRGFSPGTPVFPSPQNTTFDLICVHLLMPIYSSFPFFPLTSVYPMNDVNLDQDSYCNSVTKKLCSLIFYKIKFTVLHKSLFIGQ